MRKLLKFLVYCILFIGLIGICFGTVRDTVRDTVYETVLEAIDPMDVNEEHIYISSSAGAGGDGSITTPYDAPSDINWTTGGDNSIFDWVADGSKVYINLKRGDTFNEELSVQTSGAANAYITIQAYSSGAKPIIKNTINLDDASDWTNSAGNIWYATATTEIGLIMSNNSVIGGAKKWDTSLTTQGDFFSDEGANRLYLYSIENPGTFYTDIECTLGDNTASVSIENDIDYINIYNLHTTLSGHVGIHLWRDNQYINIIGNDISYCGGQEQGAGGGEVRNGGGFTIQDGAKHIVFRHNTVWQNYDGGIAIQGYAVGLDLEDIVMSYNLLYENTYNLEIWGAEVTSSFTDIYFVHNACLDAGGWSQAQRADQQAQSLRITRFLGSVSNVQIKNNLISGATSLGTSALLYTYNVDQGFDLLDVDYNSYYTYNNSDTVWHTDSTDFTLSEFAGYKTASSQDANSLNSNPDITSIGKLETGSLALNTGVVISGINNGSEQDIWGNATDSTPNIGVYQGTGYVCDIPDGYEQLVDGNGDNIYDNDGECIVVPSGATIYWNTPRTDYWADTRTSLWSTARNATP